MQHPRNASPVRSYVTIENWKFTLVRDEERGEWRAYAWDIKEPFGGFKTPTKDELIQQLVGAMHRPSDELRAMARPARLKGKST